MLDLTAVKTSGTFIDAERVGTGIGTGSSKSISNHFWGSALDLGKQLFSTLILAYAVVFSLQVIGMLIAGGC